MCEKGMKFKMKDDLLPLVPFKLALIIISHDFKDINKGLTPTNDISRLNLELTFC